MVQVGASFGYHEEVEEKEPVDSWTDQVRSAVKDFVGSVGESTKHLADAAEKFTSESLQAIEDATGKALAAATTSTEMATNATQAATEARQTAVDVSSAVAQAGERVRQEILDAIDAAVSQATESLQTRTDEAIVKIEASLSAAGDIASQIETLNQTSDQLKAEVQRHVDAVYERIEGIGQEAVIAAQQAAEAARAAATEAGQQVARLESMSSESSVGASAQDVLERLETDYELLARLVQELHSRIATLGEVSTTPTPEITADEPVSQEPASTYEAPAQMEPVESMQSGAYESLAEPQVAAPPAQATWYQPEPEPQPVIEETPAESPIASAEAEAWAQSYDTPAYVPTSSYTEPVESAAAPESTPVSQGSGETLISGRMLVSISPVPDFDRLLSLDGALGRMSGVRNVTLADYAKEEVTFRIEVENPMAAAVFGEGLAESAGMRVEVVSAGEGTLALRLPN